MENNNNTESQKNGNTGFDSRKKFSRPFGQRGSSGGGRYPDKKGFNNKKGGRGGKPFSKGQRDRRNNDNFQDYDSKVIDVKRVTRVSKGGKRMRFSALVVVGDKKGRVGFGIKKGLDFQDAVAKATKKAKENMIKIKLNDQHSLDFPSKTKFKAVEILLKPATQGTGVIAGGFVRPVLELAGVNNIYSKIFRSRNKFSGVQAVFKALETYK